MFLTTLSPSAISAPLHDFEEGAAPAASSFFFLRWRKARGPSGGATPPHAARLLALPARRLSGPGGRGADINQGETFGSSVRLKSATLCGEGGGRARNLPGQHLQS